MNIALLGYGKMGKTIESLINNHKVDSKFVVVNRITQSNASENYHKTCDIAIDFSTPHSVLGNIEQCFQNNTPIVVGTTGWYGKMETVKSWQKQYNGALFYASNFSIGMNITFALNSLLAQKIAAFEQYSPKIKELHHKQKLDQPSGTALTLAEEILWHHKKLDEWEFTDSIKSKSQLPIECVREDDIKGTHIVTYTSEIDQIKIQHEAYSRDGFAFGALHASRFLQGKTGIYTMKDLLA